ncbi:hypothetical protein LCGC14_2826220 [marine sediment metagenome]|uniref:Uncharacterized protein n=1 Tax=marine sediment metagenome TaxID=412755 RepID=A0A0F9ANV5_9ZZZZ
MVITLSLVCSPYITIAKTVLKLGIGDPINSDRGAFAKQFKYLHLSKGIPMERSRCSCLQVVPWATNMSSKGFAI